MRRGKASSSPSRSRSSRHEVVMAAAFLAPALLTILGLRVFPMFKAIWSSLHQGLPGSILPPDFAGLQNYVDLFGNPAFQATLWRTVIFNVIINPLQVVLALAVAVVMVQRVPLRGLWRTLVFIPVTIPIVGSSIAWSIAMRSDGPLNVIIEALGGRPQEFLNSPDQALASIMLIASWIGIGYWMLFLISGLEAIPTEYYEAARLDRAGKFRIFFQITLPLLKRPMLFVLVANLVANFIMFVPMQMLTNGGPESSTTLLMFDAYRTTYQYGNRNLGSAQVVILTLVMLLFVALQFRLMREDSDGRRK